MTVDRVDWHRISTLDGVRAIASAIRARWPLWVGLVTRSGVTIPIGTVNAGESRPHLPICEAFMRRSDSAGSCSRSLLTWSALQQPSIAACHAHLQAVVQPVGERPADAALYASGFVTREAGQERLTALVERADALRLSRSEVEAQLASIPRLDTPDREAVEALLQVARDVIEPELSPADEALTPRHDYSHIIGQSPEIVRLFGVMDRVVGNDSTILIQGENGTGKELFARAVHANSRRRDHAFVTQNCSALNDNLLDSELFGHKRGAFTGAVADKKGLFEVADEGTLFLDEVGDMSRAMQVKLLRVLQEGTFVPVGDTVTRKVDVRFIAASNRRLQDLVALGAFREDLFYRLNVISLEVPPLRKRRSDIPLLIDHFVAEYARRTRLGKMQMSDRTVKLLMAYDWPGNVRELRHEVERLVVLCGADMVNDDLISRRIVESVDPERLGTGPGEDATLPEAVEALERRMILTALDELDWNKTRAAARLGVSRRNLIRKVQAYGLRKREDSPQD